MLEKRMSDVGFELWTLWLIAIVQNIDTEQAL